MQLKKQNKVLAIDIGATNTRFAVVDGSKAEIIKRIPTPNNKSDLLKGVESMVDLIGQSFSPILALSVAGPVDPVDKKTAYLTNITKSKVNFSELNTKNAEIVVINDGGAAVWAERTFGYGKNINNLAYITISSGIGGGVVVDSRLVFFDSIADEIGHQKVDTDYLLKCGCGGVGHWESLTSGFNIPNFFSVWAKKSSLKFDPGHYGDVYQIFKKAKEGDRLALRFMKEVGLINAAGIDQVVKNHKPEVIILGGAVALNNKEIILSGINKYRKSKVPIEFTRLGDEICLIGAAAYAQDGAS